MVSRAYSIEDGNLNQTTIRTSRKRAYSDLDLTFARKVDNDVFKKLHASAVKQAIKNLLLTNRAEKPFNPFFGGNLNDFLFELNDGLEESDIEQQVVTAISNYEPRARVINVKATANPDRNDISVTVVFQVVTTNEEVTLTVDLARLR